MELWKEIINKNFVVIYYWRHVLQEITQYKHRTFPVKVKKIIKNIFE
jgi:hypothetical protein